MYMVCGMIGKHALLCVLVSDGYRFCVPYIGGLFSAVGDRTRPISITSFRDHVQTMHMERNKGFEQEYKVGVSLMCNSTNIAFTLVVHLSIQSLKQQSEGSRDIAKMPCNASKNRFANIYPCELEYVM